MKAGIMDLKPLPPQLSLTERDRRWRAARERMAARGIDCLIVWGNTISQGLGMTNVRYLTQVGSWHGGIALLPNSMNAVLEEIKTRRYERGKIGIVTYGNVVAGNNLTYHDYLAF